jgi:hypothetical protein
VAPHRSRSIVSLGQELIVEPVLLLSESYRSEHGHRRSDIGQYTLGQKRESRVEAGIVGIPVVRSGRINDMILLPPSGHHPLLVFVVLIVIGLMLGASILWVALRKRAALRKWVSLRKRV